MICSRCNRKLERRCELSGWYKCKGCDRVFDENGKVIVVVDKAGGKKDATTS
jgi:ribosomal protein L37AE/L43A